MTNKAPSPTANLGMNASKTWKISMPNIESNFHGTWCPTEIGYLDEVASLFPVLVRSFLSSERVA
jgi:hypothetical protein